MSFIITNRAKQLIIVLLNSSKSIHLGPGERSAANRVNPPVFDVVTGTNLYYVFEIGSNANLLDNPPHTNDCRFYSNWNDPCLAAIETKSPYKLSQAAWDLINRNDNLYYASRPRVARQVGTTVRRLGSKC